MMGILFWECTFPPLVEIRENPEFHELMEMDKSFWPRCLALACGSLPLALWCQFRFSLCSGIFAHDAGNLAGDVLLGPGIPLGQLCLIGSYLLDFDAESAALQVR